MHNEVLGEFRVFNQKSALAPPPPWSGRGVGAMSARSVFSTDPPLSTQTPPLLGFSLFLKCSSRSPLAFFLHNPKGERGCRPQRSLRSFEEDLRRALGISKCTFGSLRWSIDVHGYSCTWKPWRLQTVYLEPLEASNLATGALEALKFSS